MPIAPQQILTSIGLSHSGTVRWGDPIPHMQAGVYVVSTCNDASVCEGWSIAPFDTALVDEWIVRVPAMRLGGAVPDAPAIVRHLSSFWHAAECIVYIGKATSLRGRLQQFNSHKLGSLSPHKGGHWLKALSRINDLWIHYACTPSGVDPRLFEVAALDAFQANLIAGSTSFSSNPVGAIPFANRSHRGRKQKLLSCEEA